MTDPLAQLQQALADRYQIDRQLGQGGMASVYLAHDRRNNRPVAIKVLRPELAAVLGAERFLQEIKTTGNLQHPHILPLFDSGQAGPFLYYVMPYVEGKSLRDRLNQERQLPVAEAVQIAQEVAGALDYAHRRGVIHRDIKPENILLLDGLALVADFGIALAPGDPDSTRLTATGMSLGTPQYMSPEQAMGESAVDARTDIYALGAVLYEMLSGEPPFPGATAQAIIARMMTTDAPSLTAQRRTIPPAVDAAVHKALQRAPADRFATAAAFAAALDAPASAGPGLPWRRVLVGTTAVALVALALGYLGRRREAADRASPDFRVVAVLPFRNLSADSGQRYFGDGMTEAITGQLGKVAALRVLGRAATAPYDTAGNRLERLAKELGVGSVVDGSVALAGDQVRINVELTDVRTGVSLWSERYDRKLADLFAVQDDVARKITDALQATLSAAESERVAKAPTSNMAAYQLYLRGYELSAVVRDGNRRQAELLTQAIGMDSSFAAAWATLARNYMFRAVAGEPAWHDSAMAAARRAIALDPDLAEGYFALGDLLSGELKLSDARRAYLKALELSPSHGGAMADLGNLYVTQGRLDEALDWAVKAYWLDPNHRHGPYHVALPLIQLNDDSVSTRYLLAAERRMPAELRNQGLLAWLEYRKGQPAAALARARRMVEEHPGSTEGLPILAELAFLAGAPDAERLLKPLVDADPLTPSQYSPVGLRSMYALELRRRGDDAAARRLWAQSAAAAEAQLKEGAEGPAAPMELAAIHAIEGDTAAALDWLEQGYRAGWRDARQLRLDPFFEPLGKSPRYLAVLASIDRDVAEMRRRAAAAHPEIFGTGPAT